MLEGWVSGEWTRTEMSLGRRSRWPGKRVLAFAGPFGNNVLLQLVIGTLDQLLRLNAALSGDQSQHQLLLHLPLHDSQLAELPSKSDNENFLHALHRR